MMMNGSKLKRLRDLIHLASSHNDLTLLYMSLTSILSRTASPGQTKEEEELSLMLFGCFASSSSSSSIRLAILLGVLVSIFKVSQMGAYGCEVQYHDFVDVDHDIPMPRSSPFTMFCIYFDLSFTLPDHHTLHHLHRQIHSS